MHFSSKLLFISLIICTISCLNANGPDGAEYQFTWQSQTSNITASIRGIDVIDDSSAWISGTGGQYAITKDAGANWMPAVVTGADSLDFRDIAAFSNGTTYLLSAGPGEKSRVYKSTDGGKNWQLQFTSPFPNGFFSAMAFWDDKSGIAFSDPVDGRFAIISTTDGGENWRQLAPEQMPPAIDGEYAFAASGTCLIAGDGGNAWIASGGAAARVFHSPDYGKSWSVFDTAMRSGTPSAGIFSIAFKDANNGIAVGGDYQNPEVAENNVARTTDGGKTWQLLANPAELAYRSCVRYLEKGDLSILIAVGRSGCSYSTDDGLTWHDFGNEVYYTFDISPSGNSIWAAGSDGRVAKLKIDHL